MEEAQVYSSPLPENISSYVTVETEGGEEEDGSRAGDEAGEAVEVRMERREADDELSTGEAVVLALALLWEK